METSNTDAKIYFSGDTAEIISNILKKYSLEETDEELAKKMLAEEDVPFIIRGGLILETAISLVKKELFEKDAIIILQKELNVSQIIAEGIITDIKIGLVPIATPKKDVIKKEEPPINTMKEKNDREVSATESPERKKLEKIKKPIVIEKFGIPIPQTRQQKGPDSYREQIE